MTDRCDEKQTVIDADAARTITRSPMARLRIGARSAGRGMM